MRINFHLKKGGKTLLEIFLAFGNAKKKISLHKWARFKHYKSGIRALQANRKGGKIGELGKYHLPIFIIEFGKLLVFSTGNYVRKVLFLKQ